MLGKRVTRALSIFLNDDFNLTRVRGDQIKIRITQATLEVVDVVIIISWTVLAIQ